MNNLRKRRIRPVLLALAMLIAAVALWILTHTKPSVPPDLAPGAAAAIRRALGDAGIARITQVISTGNRPSAVSGGTRYYFRTKDLTNLNVKRFRFSVRPITTVVFRNVAITPDKPAGDAPVGVAPL